MRTTASANFFVSIQQTPGQASLYMHDHVCMRMQNKQRKIETDLDAAWIRKIVTNAARAYLVVSMQARYLFPQPT
jgi:hypothetical protein